MPTAQPRPIRTLLVANRGEIAYRIVRTARRMGIRTVAVFSDADRTAMHTTLADEAIRIGPAPAGESYLDIARILDAAKAMDADAIHPGYGFLSESAAFAEACAGAGIVFVGPPVEAIRAMGSKSAAKAIMERSGVPMVPGYHGEAQDLATLASAAERIGYPVLVKAAAGGGGKGMRVAEAAPDLEGAIGAARREAAAAFGDDRLLIEKYLTRPRHIEVQVFGDSHGSVVSLFERECTLQRRHQKVIEEAPAAMLSEADREAMGAAARQAAAAVGYTNAGTVEFVADDSGFYFIEMNTRLQVEHPVTEAITGLDLVEWQLRIAAGEPLPLTQAQIARHGHAFEVRIYAEDPASGFLPSIGRIAAWQEPSIHEDLRIDTGFRQGDTVTPFYDPMLAKLIVHAGSRDEALARLRAALDGFAIAGVKTNLSFLRRLIDLDAVKDGRMDTGLIERELPNLLAEPPVVPHDIAAAVGALLAREAEGAPRGASPWSAQDGWSIAGSRARRLQFGSGGSLHEAVLTYRRQHMALALADGEQEFSVVARDGGGLDVWFGGRKETITSHWSGQHVRIGTPRGVRSFDVQTALEHDASIDMTEARIRSPMPGAIRHILAAAGDVLERGAPVLVVEAMKMEHMLRAPSRGTLVALKCAVGDFVQEGTDLADFEPSPISS